MHKKYKIKKKHQINIYIIFSLIIFVSLFVTSGYALWSDKLEIKGHANIKVKTTEELPKMTVDIPIAYASVTLPASGFKLISNEVTNGALTTIVETTDMNTYSQSGIFTFYYENKTGYTVTEGKTVVTVTGSADGIGNITPSIQETVYNQSLGRFHTYIPMAAGNILTETKINIQITYNVNGEIQAFYYYVILRPMQTT